MVPVEFFRQQNDLPGTWYQVSYVVAGVVVAGFFIAIVSTAARQAQNQ